MATSTHVPHFEYQFIEGVESLERYRHGGYHPVQIGEVLRDRCRVIHKLGHGTYSTIWLARDEKQAAYVAIKIGTGDSSPREAGILNALQHGLRIDKPCSTMIPRIQDQFEIHGRNGSHRCLATTPAQSSVAAANSARLFPIEVARALVAQLIMAVSYIHAQMVVHGGESTRLSLYFHTSRRLKDTSQRRCPIHPRYPPWECVATLTCQF